MHISDRLRTSSWFQLQAKNDQIQTYGLLTAHVSWLLGDKSQARAAQTVIMRAVAHQLAEETLWTYKPDLFLRRARPAKSTKCTSLRTNARGEI